MSHFSKTVRSKAIIPWYVISHECLSALPEITPLQCLHHQFNDHD